MIKPIRVLQVFARMDRGGAETMIMNLYRNIDRLKVQFDFIVHTEEKCAYDEEIKALGGNIYSVPKYIGKNHFQYIKAWNEFFQKHPEYKIIHGHIRSTAAVYLKIAKKYGLVAIAHSHNISSGNGVSAFIKNIMQYPIRNTADYFFACSMSAGKWLYGNKSLEKDNFYILKNAIEVSDFVFNEGIRTRKRKELQVEGKFVIGHVGRFHPQKNHIFLIDIFKEIRNVNKNSVLLLVGDGEHKETIGNKVDKLGLSESVIFTGARADVAELFQAMDVFLFPSKYEGLGMVAIEAQGAGLPCVMADTIPQEVFITHNIVSLSLRDSIKTWAKAVRQFESMNIRQNNYKIMLEAGYDVKSNTSFLEEFYKENV